MELGKEQYKTNYNVGVMCANICDVIVVVNNTNKDALIDGIKKSGFNLKNLYFFETLADAQQHFKDIFNSASVVLMENDLPDNYN